MDAPEKIADSSSLTEVAVSNTIALNSAAMRVNKIQQLTLAPLLAEAIRRIHEKSSISAIFTKGTVEPKNEKRISMETVKKA